MNSLSDVRNKVKDVAEILETIHNGEREPTHEDVTAIRDDLNACAEAVQTIRDKSF